MYCNICQEERNDHPSICTSCGERLQQQPHQQQRQPTPNRREQTNNINLLTSNNITTNANELATILNAQAQRGFEISPPEEWATTAGAFNNTAPEWEQPPPEALDPSTNSTNSRPTSKKFIDHIPRICVDAKSFILYDASVEILLSGMNGNNNNNSSSGTATNVFHATIGELCHATIPPYKIKGTIHTIHSLKQQQIKSNDDCCSVSSRNTIAYFTRGGGTTFASMTQQAKQVGAIGIIVGNNSSIWPYIMKESSTAPNKNNIGNEASKQNNNIPAVMIKRSDGKLLLSQLSQQPSITATLQVKKSNHEGCVICREAFQLQDKVIRLPFCFHCFHEECALFWLRKNNTCPCCRKELPTDDEEYEIERRRLNRGYAGSGTQVLNNNWESMFG